jgi:hypothetical protein
MEKEFVALGAVEEDEGDYSYFTIPNGTSEDVKNKIKDLENDTSRKSPYSAASRITYEEFVTRQIILATITRLLSEAPRGGTRTEE